MDLTPGTPEHGAVTALLVEALRAVERQCAADANRTDLDQLDLDIVECFEAAEIHRMLAEMLEAETLLIVSN